MKTILTLILLGISLFSNANQDLLKSIKGIEYSKQLASKGLGEFAINELNSTKSTLLSIDDSTLSDYQQNMKLNLINEIKDLLDKNIETTSKCEFLYSSINNNIDKTKNKTNVIENWTTLRIINDKMKKNPDCKMLKIVQEKIQKIINKA